MTSSKSSRGMLTSSTAMTHGMYNYTSSYNPDDDYQPCSRKIMPSLFAWFLLLSTTSAYFTLVLPMYIDLIGLHRAHLFATLLAAHSILFLYVVINFLIATFMDPGRFPKIDVSQSIEESQKPSNGPATHKTVLINDINVRMKWCTTCQFYRPPRSSHCGVCNACIDTMDHHCPWVCNCIGRRNYKYFLQFLISLTTHMLIILTLCVILVMYNKEHLTHIPVVVSFVLIVIVSVLILPIGGLTMFHLVLVTRGRTTNEQVTGKFRTGVNPFDVGCCANWQRTVCEPAPPSYIKFRRERQRERDYFQTQLLLSKYKLMKHGNNVAPPIAAAVAYYDKQSINTGEVNIDLVNNKTKPTTPPTTATPVRHTKPHKSRDIIEEINEEAHDEFDPRASTRVQAKFVPSKKGSRSSTSATSSDNQTESDHHVWLDKRPLSGSPIVNNRQTSRLGINKQQVPPVPPPTYHIDSGSSYRAVAKNVGTNLNGGGVKIKANKNNAARHQVFSGTDEDEDLIIRPSSNSHHHHHHNHHQQHNQLQSHNNHHHHHGNNHSSKSKGVKSSNGNGVRSTGKKSRRSTTDSQHGGEEQLMVLMNSRQNGSTAAQSRQPSAAHVIKPDDYDSYEITV